MTTPRNSTIGLLSSGVPGLDTVLGGGLPEYSFNLIAGGPGAGLLGYASAHRRKGVSLHRVTTPKR
jgi:predicted ATP-dependent serine protease